MLITRCGEYDSPYVRIVTNLGHGDLEFIHVLEGHPVSWRIGVRKNHDVTLPFNV
jgi:hypothetical protein